MISLGIDLGTTYSCAIHRASDGTEEIIQTIDGDLLIPSVVHFLPGDGAAEVGQSAKEALAFDQDNVVVGIKRQMGKEFPQDYCGRTLTPEGISSLILSSIAQDAAGQLRASVDQLLAVITVPAYFGLAEREATSAAARLAGLQLAELIPEPVAAAMAYGTDASNSSVLVFDLGGGTLDVAVVSVDQQTFRVWAVDGESRLGGLDWDARLANLLWEQLDQLGNVDLRYDDEVVSRVAAAAERLKRQLTGAESATIRLQFEGASLALSVTRQQFELACHDLGTRCSEAVDRVLSQARGLKAPQPSAVLLAGGSTRMPMIRALLKEHLHLPVLLSDPDKAVARGAAIHAAQLLKAGPLVGAMRRAPSARGLIGVVPRGLGIQLSSSRDPYQEAPIVKQFIASNTPLPAQARIMVSTVVDGQPTAALKLYEQGGLYASELVADNKLILDGEITLAGSSRAGSPITIDVSVSEDGRLRVEASDGSGHTLKMEAFMHGVIDEAEVADQQRAVNSLELRR